MNSLFLLDDVQGLFRSNRGRFRHVVVVCDDLDGPNYRAFYRDRPWLDGVFNRGALDQPGVCRLFDRCGYEPVETRGCTFLPSYALGENPASLMALGGLDAFARLCGLPANYWIGVFRRRDDAGIDITAEVEFHGLRLRDRKREGRHEGKPNTHPAMLAGDA